MDDSYYNSFLLAAQLEDLLLDLLAQLQQPLDQRLWARRAAGHVDIHRHERVHALHRVITIVELTTRGGALAHRDDPLGIGHLLIQTDKARPHLDRDGARDDHQVSLARAGAEDLRAKAREIVVRLPGGDHLDGAAGEAIAQWPDRAAARVV